VSARSDAGVLERADTDRAFFRVFHFVDQNLLESSLKLWRQGGDLRNSIVQRLFKLFKKARRHQAWVKHELTHAGEHAQSVRSNLR
jgi:hypothetical protein